jgi:hypothetical protein
MDFTALRTLIETHPSHAATSDPDMVTWLTDATAVTRSQTHLPNSEIQDIALSETTEWNALTDAQRATFGQIIAIREQVPVEAGTPTRSTLQDILGTQTKIALGAALPEDVSRLNDAGLGTTVADGEVAYARTFGD